MVLPYMASLVAKKKGHQLYYYVVESARVDGKPRIVHQTYLAPLIALAALVKDRTAPVPPLGHRVGFRLAWSSLDGRPTFRRFSAALESLWPQPRSGPSTAHYLLLALIHRVCQPGPKPRSADWYKGTILHSLWGFPPERFTRRPSGFVST